MYYRNRSTASGKDPGYLQQSYHSNHSWRGIDVVITDYGIAINPRRQDLIEAMKGVDLPFKTIERHA